MGGDDTLDGGADNDLLVGGPGADTLKGGAGDKDVHHSLLIFADGRNHQPGYRHGPRRRR